jgi:N-acetylmuramoyl-L-alanine amidase
MTIVEMPRIGTQVQMQPAGIIVHAMAEYLDTEPYDIDAYNFLRNHGLSAHYLVSPSGCVLKCAEETQVCYHAKGRNAWNDEEQGAVGTVGIEILVPGLHTYASFADRIRGTEWCYHKSKQWGASVELVRDILQRHDILPTEVKRHSDVSPGRKVDPGKGFLWEKFLREVEGI